MNRGEWKQPVLASLSRQPSPESMEAAWVRPASVSQPERPEAVFRLQGPPGVSSAESLEPREARSARLSFRRPVMLLQRLADMAPADHFSASSAWQIAGHPPPGPRLQT